MNINSGHWPFLVWATRELTWNKDEFKFWIMTRPDAPLQDKRFTRHVSVLSPELWLLSLWMIRVLMVSVSPWKENRVITILHLLLSLTTALVWINHGASHKHSGRDMNTNSAIDKWIVLVDDSVPVRVISRLLHFMNISLRLSPYQSDIFASLNFLKAF